MSESIRRRVTGMSFKGCMQAATSLVGNERTVLLASLLKLMFTLNEIVQAHSGFSEFLRRKVLRYGAPMLMVLVKFAKTTASSS